MSSSYCPECGTRTDPNSQFCGSCGSSIQAGPSKPAPQEPSGYQQPPQQGYQRPQQFMAARKEPSLAAILTIFIPGFAHFYNDRIGDESFISC